MSRNYSLLMMEKPNVPSELATLVHFKYKQVYTEDKKSKEVAGHTLPDSFISR